MNAPLNQRFDDLDPAQQAGILCNDPRFQQFVGTRTIKSGVTVTSSGCAEYIRTICKVTSRRQLTHNPDAKTRFQSLRTEFDAWTGKITTPR